MEQREPDSSSQPFTALAEELVDTHGRLIELAESCRTQADMFSAREVELGTKERAIDDERERLDQELGALSLREDELHAKMALVEEAERRVQQAHEQETRLAALGNELLARFGPEPPG